MDSHNLANVLSNGHPSSPLPATVSPGTKAVDAILATRGLQTIACGQVPDDYGADSDHAVLWADFSMESIFGCKRATDLPKPRRLKIQDPRIRNRYLDCYSRLADELRLSKRAYDLELATAAGMTPQNSELLIQLMQDRDWAMTTAEERCRKLRMGGIPWSPTLQEARKKVRFWTLSLAKLRGRTVKGTQLRRLRRSVDPFARHELSETFCKQRLDEAWTHYKEVTAEAHSLRSNHLEALAQAIAKDKGVEAAGVIRRLMQNEEIRSTYRRIRWMTDQGSRKGLMSVRIPTPDDVNPARTIEDRSALEEACMDENARRFRQAQLTPFLRTPLVADFGPIGNQETVDRVLAGTYEPPPGTDPFSRRLLQALRRDEHAGTSGCESRITSSDFLAMWSKASERTSSSPFSCHFGHWKAIASRPILAETNACIASICYTSGFSPPSWRKAVNVFLEKKQGVIDVDRLRIILLFDAEFNFTNKLTGRRMMQFAERHNLIAPEQFGSRAGHSAIDHALNKRLTFDFWRLKKENATLCSNDAKGCYDRIVHSVASIAMQRLGIGPSPVRLMLSTVQELQHFVRTHFGDSSVSTSTSNGDIVHGIGQGNGSGPAIWVAISTPLLNILRRDGFGATIQGVLSGEQMRMVGFAVVDDTDLIQEATTAQTAASAIANMQKSLDLWEGVLTATGGALVPEKSFWYLVSFKFEKGKWRYARADDTPGDLTMRNAAGERILVDRCEHDEARRTLGVRLAPDGNNRAQMQHMVDVGKTWGQQLRSGHVRRTDSWIALTTTILKTLEYPLLATTLSDKECDAILRPVLRAALPSSGLVFSFPRSILYGTTKAGGLGLRNLATTQGIQHVTACLSHGHTMTLTGRLIRANIEMAKLVAGFPGSFFRLPFHWISSYVDETWILAVSRFLDKHRLKLDERTPNLVPRCDGDLFIMERLFHIGFEKHRLRQVNLCRLYMRATTVADISSGDGRFLPQWALQGTRRCHTRRAWPFQPRPPPSAWREWRCALSFLCVGSSFTLHTPLGDWTDTNHSFLLSPDRMTIWECRPDGFVTFRCRAGRASRRAIFVRAGVQTGAPPAGSSPAEVDLSDNSCRLLGSRPIKESRREPRSPDMTGLRPLMQALTVGPIIAVSDGSFKDQTGAAAWVFTTLNGDIIFESSSLVSGCPTDQSAFRSEVFGLLGIVGTLLQLHQSWPNLTGTITVGCDGESALFQSLQTDRRPSPAKAHFDLISTIHAIRHRLPFTLVPKHVSGHQDKHGGPLDLLELLNVRMDTQAKLSRVTRNVCNYTSDLPSTEGAWVLAHSHVITGEVDSTIRSIVHDSTLRQYWIQRRSLSNEVDWEAFGTAASGQTVQRRIWWVKHVSGFSATAKVLHRRRVCDRPTCPRCELVTETSDHVLRCSAHAARSEQEKARTDFVESITSLGTSPAMCEVFLSNVSDWQQNVAFPRPTRTPGLLSVALHSQNQLGWDNFLVGFISVHWRSAFQLEQSSCRYPRVSSFWASQVIRRIWLIPWTLWDRRNRMVHDKQEREENLQEVIATSTRVAQLYRAGSGRVPLQFRHLFNQSLVSILRRPMAYKKAWILSVEAGDSTSGST